MIPESVDIGVFAIAIALEVAFILFVLWHLDD